MYMYLARYDLLYDWYDSVICHDQVCGGKSFARPNHAAESLLKDTSDESTKQNTSTFLL